MLGAKVAGGGCLIDRPCVKFRVPACSLHKQKSPYMGTMCEYYVVLHRAKVSSMDGNLLVEAYRKVCRTG